MTLVLSLLGRDTMWMLVDRRLSYDRPRRFVDNATKVLSLDTPDGVAMLGYAGLGATALRTEPSKWMSAALRGRGDLPMEQALEVLSEAANRELPKHIAQLKRARVHFIVVPAFIRDVGPRLYSIDNVIEPGTGRHYYRYASHQRTQLPGSPSFRIAFAGSGADYLGPRRQQWTRPLRQLAKAHDAGKISDLVVADHLAKLNLEVHRRVKDGSVGPRCIVVWRRRPDGRHGPGGAHHCYTGATRNADTPAIPTIVDGNDLQSMAEAAIGHLRSEIQTIDAEALAKRFDALPSEPDERLR